jgi:hypothetical protein
VLCGKLWALGNRCGSSSFDDWQQRKVMRLRNSIEMRA